MNTELRNLQDAVEVFIEKPEFHLMKRYKSGLLEEV